ncbi:MAG: hypothetical protein KDA54_20055 [Phycisphaerales bacterium]|nr:hypothetical protein [Phycisphaerales bacterium]
MGGDAMIAGKDNTVNTQRDDQQDGSTIYQATIIDLVNRKRIGSFGFSADSIEEARERGWRIAGSLYGNDTHVRIERLSK